MKKVLILFLSLGMILSVISGCSTAATKNTGVAAASTVSAEAAVTASTAATSQPQGSAAATVTAKKGGELKIIVKKSPVSFGYPPKCAGGDRDTVDALFDRLLAVDDKGEYQPALATSWKFSEDGKTLTFKLREGVKFHDGTDFNAEAVKFNIDALIPPQSTLLAGISSVDVIDNFNVKINLEAYNNMILYQLASAYECFMYSPTAFKANGVDWMITHPVGTGPFKFDSIEKDTYVKLVKNPNYWNEGLPYLDSITWLVINDGMTQQLTFKSGQADGIFGVSASVASTLKAEGAIIKSAPGTLQAICFDTVNNPALADVRVREAIEYAIDKKAICEGPGFGEYEPIYQVVPSSSAAYNKECEARIYNPEKAKKLLAEAGYANGLTIDCWFLESYWKDGVAAIQASLAQSGITLNITYGNSAAYNAIRAAGKINAGTASQMNLVWNANPLFTMDFYWKAKPAHFNFIKTPAECDELLKKAKATMDQNETNKICQQITKILYEDETIIPLWVNPQIVVLSKDVKNDGFFINGDSSNITLGDNTWLDR